MPTRTEPTSTPSRTPGLMPGSPRWTRPGYGSRSASRRHALADGVLDPLQRFADLRRVAPAALRNVRLATAVAAEHTRTRPHQVTCREAPATRLLVGDDDDL